MPIKTNLRRNLSRKLACLSAAAALVATWGCKTFDSTEEDVARERMLYEKGMQGRDNRDRTDPGVFWRPRN